MSYAAYDGRSQQTPRHDGYSREYDAASRRAANMTPWPNSSYDTYRSYDTYDTYSRSDARARSPPRRSARERTWPPPPSVEDDPAPQWGAEGEPPLNTRGTVDQESLLDDVAQDNRFVLVSNPDGDDRLRPRTDNGRDRRRKSVAERGHMAPIQTNLEEPPVFTERVSTPYAYTRPQRESTAPSPPRDLQRDQNARPSKPTPTHSRTPVFDDSDLEAEDTTLLRAARQPARYSFVKSDLQKEDLRTNLRDTQPRPEARPPPLPTERSSASSKDNVYAQSPRSSTSSLNTANRKPRPADLPYSTGSRNPSRPSSPSQRAPSPRLPTRLRDSPSSSRPSSRGNTRPPSPPSSATVQASSGRTPIVDFDRYSTYPSPTANDRSRPSSRYGRYETMPIPAPRIDVKSPSPARPPPGGPSALPYPIDDHPTQVFMPTEEHYQFDHSTVNSPRQTYPDSPRVSSSIPASPRIRDATFYPSRQNATLVEDPTHKQRTRSGSLRSQSSQDGRREQSAKKNLPMDMDKPLPSCPRSGQLGRFDDWYSLEESQNFDICPSCYEGVFANTPFAVHFSQNRRYERPVERFCDFSSPWMRLAWVLTIKQRRQTLGLLYTLVDIADSDRACPGDRKLGTDRVSWYGILDQRDGLPVANFAICSCDKNMIEGLFPTMRGYFTKLSSSYQPTGSDRYLCSLRTSSRRFPKYLDLLVNLDAEAQSLGQRPNMPRFIQLVRENAFKGECAKDKLSIRKPWHFIPSLPEFTVCEECYDAVIWPATQPKSSSSSSSVSPALPRLFNKTIQLVPGEDPDIGSSCCLYSPRMRRVWETSVKEEDLTYLKRKAVERKKAEMRLTRERKGIVGWMVGLSKGSSEWERARSELKEVEREWAAWE